MLRFATFLAVLVTVGTAAAAEPPPELRRPLAAGERYYDPEKLCSAAMPDRIPTPRSYVEIERRTVWPTSADAGETIRANLSVTNDHLDDAQTAKFVDGMIRERDWAIVVIGFEAQNVHGATMALTAHCFVHPVYAASPPTPAIDEIPVPLRCTFKSLCGRP